MPREQIGLGRGWRCLEAGAGNGSLSAWIADQVGPDDVAIATDIDPDLLKDASGSHRGIRSLDVVTEEPTDGPFDLVLGRAILGTTCRSAGRSWPRWCGGSGGAGGSSCRSRTSTPPASSNRRSSAGSGKASSGGPSSIGSTTSSAARSPPWLQEEGLEEVAAEGHTTLYSGGSAYARWWQLGIAEVADQLLDQGATESGTLDELFRLYDDSSYWTMTIAFTAVTGRPSEA